MIVRTARRIAGDLARRARRPTLSVVMPCRDGGSLLEPAIRSVLNQDFRDLEVIVVDDGSIDDSPAIVRQLAARDRRVSLVRTPGGRGPGAARNLGVSKARGRYLTFADADDQVLPGAYRAMTNALRQHSVDMVVGGYQRHGATGRHRPRLVERVHAVQQTAVDADGFPQLLDEVVIWNRMFRTSFWRKKVGPFPEVGNYEDREPALKGTLHARRFTVLAEDVYSWRLPEGRRTRSQQKDDLQDLRDRFSVARREAAAVDMAKLAVRCQVWARLLGTDLGLFVVHLPTSGAEYWQEFGAMASWLVDRAPAEVWPSVPVWDRLITYCAAAGSDHDVDELLGTRAEDSTAIPLTVGTDGDLRADLEVTDRLRTPLPPDLLVVAPALLPLTCGLHRVRWASPTLIRVDGYAYVPGLSPDTDGLTLRVHQSTGDFRQLPVEPRPDDHVDVTAGDPWRSYRASGFAVGIPTIGKGTGVAPETVQLDIHLEWRGQQWMAPLTVPIPPRLDPESWDPAPPGTPTRVLLSDVRVDQRTVVITGCATPVPETLRVGLVSSAHQFDSAASLDDDGGFQVVLDGPDDRALPQDGYFVRWATSEGQLTGWARAAGRLLEGPIDSLGPQLRATARQHPNSTSVSVTLGPPLSLLERSRFGQRELRDVYRSAPLERAILLESFNGKTCGDNPGAIAAGLRAAGIDAPMYWSVQDLSIEVPGGGIPLVVGSREWHRVLATASLLINNNNFPHWFVKRPGQFYLQTWHGTPIKRLLWDLPAARVPLTYRRLMRRQVPMWDMLLAQSADAERDLRTGLGYSGPVMVVEQPRNAVLAGGRTVRDQVRASYGIRADERVILYAPTWREPDRTAGRAAAWTDALDSTALAHAADARVLVRSHHLSRRSPMTDERVVDVSQHRQVEELMLAADVLVSDYSSILHDWALLDRPAVVFVPDLGNYRDIERGFYGDWPAASPWPVAECEEQLTESVRTALQDHRSSADVGADSSVTKGCQRVIECIVPVLNGADLGSTHPDLWRDP